MIKNEAAESGIVADFFTDPSSRASKAIILLGGFRRGKILEPDFKPDLTNGHPKSI